MNGTSEQYAESAARSAQLSSEKAKEAASSALECYQSMGRTEREVVEVRREQRSLRKEMREGFEALNAVLIAPQRAPAASKSEFNPTDTGSHFIVPADQLDDLLERRKQREDATRYRRLWRRVRVLVLALATGGATLGGEQLVKWLLGH